MEAAVTATSDN